MKFIKFFAPDQKINNMKSAVALFKSDMENPVISFHIISNTSNK